MLLISTLTTTRSSPGHGERKTHLRQVVHCEGLLGNRVASPLRQSPHPSCVHVGASEFEFWSSPKFEAQGPVKLRLSFCGVLPASQLRSGLFSDHTRCRGWPLFTLLCCYFLFVEMLHKCRQSTQSWINVPDAWELSRQRISICCERSALWITASLQWN